MIDLKGRTILVVDDEPELLAVICDEFRFAGAKVLAANGYGQAIKYLENNKIDSIISELRMNDGSGIELLAKMKEHEHDAMVFMFLTRFTDLSREDAFHLGAEGVFLKPCNYDLLINAMVRALTPPLERWRRERVRVPGGFIVEVKLKGIQQAIESKVINIGRGGMFIAQNDQLPTIGQVVEFRFSFSTTESEIVVFDGRGICRWTRKGDSSEFRQGFGIEFEAISDESMKVLFKLLSMIKTKAFIPK